jgi:hypothetical protein
VTLGLPQWRPFRQPELAANVASCCWCWMTTCSCPPCGWSAGSLQDEVRGVVYTMDCAPMSKRVNTTRGAAGQQPFVGCPHEAFSMLQSAFGWMDGLHWGCRVKHRVQITVRGKDRRHEPPRMHISLSRFCTACTHHCAHRLLQLETQCYRLTMYNALPFLPVA